MTDKERNAADAKRLAVELKPYVDLAIEKEFEALMEAAPDDVVGHREQIRAIKRVQALVEAAGSYYARKAPAVA